MTVGQGPQGIFEAEATKTLEVVANGNLTVASPVGYYFDENGIATAITVAADVNSVRWGVAEVAVTDTESGVIITKGKATLASGGTAGQLVTAISNAGVITSAAAANTNADTNILGVCTAAGEMFIY